MGDAQPSANESETFFKDANTLTVSEVATVLQEHIQHMKARQPDYQANILLSKTLEYTQQFTSIRNTETLMKIRETLEREGFTQQELAMVLSLTLSDTEEAKLLVPSLDRYSDDELRRILEEIETYRQFE